MGGLGVGGLGVGGLGEGGISHRKKIEEVADGDAQLVESSAGGLLERRVLVERELVGTWQGEHTPHGEEFDTARARARERESARARVCG